MRWTVQYYRKDRPEVVHNNHEFYTSEDAALERVLWYYSEDSGLHDKYIFDAVPVWAEREQARFASGEYKLPIWSQEQFWRNTTAVHGRHFAHVSTEDPSMLSYTPDEGKGIADRQTRLKPGKYLTRYFGASEKTGLIEAGQRKGQQPVLTKQQIAFYVEWFERGEKPTRWGHLELRMASTPEEIRLAYATGPRSCMDGRSFSAHDDQNPVSVYGAGDLAVAYLVDTKDCQRVKARALCWPEKGTFGRVYPSSDYWQTDGFQSPQDSLDCHNYLKDLLRQKGWTHISERKNVFDGARLLRVQYGSHKGHYVMPYLDNEYGIVEAKGEDQSKFFIMKRDGLRAGVTGGYMLVPTMFHCDHCKQMRPETNNRGTPTAYEVATAYSVTKGPQKRERWCGTCIGETWTAHDPAGVAFSNKVPRVYDDYYGRYYPEALAKKRGAFRDTFDGTFVIPDPHDLSTTKWVVDGKPYSSRTIGRAAFFCRYDGKIYPHAAMSLKYPGMPKVYDDKKLSPKVREASNILQRTDTWNIEQGYWQNLNEPPFDQAYAIGYYSKIMRQRASAARTRELKKLNEATSGTPFVRVYSTATTAAAE